jgi:HAD superfamily hydrolase (TIGR01509 family)
MRLRGVIFDFNGTLVWDNRFHEEAWIRFARMLGVELDSRSYYQRVHGKTTRNILHDLLGREVTEDELQKFTDQKEALYRRLCIENPEAYVFAPGARQFIEQLSLKGIPMNIATASEIDNLNFFIDYFHLDRWFDTGKFVYDDHTIPNKPAPDIYVHAARRISCEPDEVMIIEDSYSGAVSAEAAGCEHIVIAGEKTSGQQWFASIEHIRQTVSDFSVISHRFF